MELSTELIQAYFAQWKTSSLTIYYFLHFRPPQIALLLPEGVAWRIFPPWLQLPVVGGQHQHRGQGEVRGELREPLRDAGRGVRREVLAMHDHVQKTPERAVI